jgi:hypothetical protein
MLADATAQTFLQQLLNELHKVSRFYVEKAEALEVRPVRCLLQQGHLQHSMVTICCCSRIMSTA